VARNGLKRDKDGGGMCLPEFGANGFGTPLQGQRTVGRGGCCRADWLMALRPGSVMGIV
jgi:hypothetical protein